MKAPIHSRKHYVQLSQSQIAQSAVLVTTISQAIEGASSTPTQVNEGAIVKAIWVEMWLVQDSASVLGSFTAGIYKNPGGTSTISAGNAAALHDWTNKKNLLYTTQALSPISDSALMLLYKGWIKVPKGKQRQGLGDRFQFFVRNNNATAIDMEVCGLFVFKEYD